MSATKKNDLRTILEHPEKAGLHQEEGGLNEQLRKAAHECLPQEVTQMFFGLWMRENRHSKSLWAKYSIIKALCYNDSLLARLAKIYAWWEFGIQVGSPEKWQEEKPANFAQRNSSQPCPASFAPSFR